MSDNAAVLEPPAALATPPAEPLPPAVTPPASEPPAPVTPPAAPPETPAPNAGPPEKYALTTPDANLISSDELAGFEQDARDLGLTNEAAQAYLDRSADRLAARAEAFLTETKADATYGGANLAQTQKHAQAAVDRFWPKGQPHGDRMRAMLRTGLGDALPIIAGLAEIGKAMAEDKPVTGGGRDGSPERMSNSEVFYGAKAAE